MALSNIIIRTCKNGHFDKKGQIIGHHINETTMPSTVNTTHPEYERMSDRWQSCRDCVEGSQAIKAAGIRYLPRLKDQDDESYRAYVMRASFVNFVWRTVSSLAGMLFRKPPEIEVAASIEPLLDDVTLDGRSLYIFAQQVALEVLTSGRAGVLVDYPNQSTEGMTLADTAKLNLRPLLAQYKAENIINWKQQRIDNEMRLTLVVLTEDAALEGNEYEHKTETRYRVLDLLTGLYRQRVFRINDKQEDEQVGPDIYPMMNGKAMSEIPFIFIGIDDTTPEMDTPPLVDLADCNLAHYRLNADYAHGLHFTGLPTAVVSGYTPENAGDKLYIGSQSAWVFPDPAARAAYLEFTGVGLGSIETALKSLEEQIAVLGARLLASEKKGNETATAARIYRAGETSILSAIANTISTGLSEALEIFSEWAGVPDEEAEIELNRDFIPANLDAQQLTALVSAWSMGALSLETLFENLQAGEIIGQDVTYEMEQARIEEGAPAPPPAPVIVKKDDERESGWGGAQ
jgi:hypothetical protein